MHFRTAAVVFAASFVTAQDISQLPDCSRACFVDNFPVSGCASQTDFACLCASSAYNTAVTSCILASGCSTEDVPASLNWATATCESVGVPIEVGA
ncbi:GPI-anchored CFEM domain protein B [Colletotrichum sidae]|uniref:GPI-anchored CFEM domain protein B n=1 Tax=Colletotrichum sidae TaxID=1347389 RepID=A0A4R8T170_9PEZI|nr:GPI-anchored CFEM domain protein B [Colletotrichum sidae]